MTDRIQCIRLWLRYRFHRLPAEFRSQDILFRMCSFPVHARLPDALQNHRDKADKVVQPLRQQVEGEQLRIVLFQDKFHCLPRFVPQKWCSSHQVPAFSFKTVIYRRKPENQPTESENGTKIAHRQLTVHQDIRRRFPQIGKRCSRFCRDFSK